jgi:DNA-binding MarR family transcriptional regulator
MIAEIERAAHLIGVQLEHAASDLGLTQAEAHVLAQLARRGSLTVGDLHREFGHKRSTLTNVLDRLETRSLVERSVNPGDRRSFVVSLTVDGERVARRVAAILDQLERAVGGEVQARDLAGVRAVASALGRVVRTR